MPDLASVLPDIAALDQELTYSIPQSITNLEVGSIVRIPVHGRRVDGWITDLNPQHLVDAGYETKPIDGFASLGPLPEVLNLASWAADQWVSKRSIFFRAASPNRRIKKLPSGAAGYEWPKLTQTPQEISSAFKTSGVLVTPPGMDLWGIIEELLKYPNPLILTPFVAQARNISERLRQYNLPVALMPEDWDKARAGSCITVGTRPAVFAPVKELGAILVLEEQDEAYYSPSSPTYNTREIAQERARRLNVPCLLVSSAPSLEAQRQSNSFRFSAQVEAKFWPNIQVVDCLNQQRQREGLFTEPLLWHLRDKSKKIVCILNRKGRIRLLACKKCERLTTCKVCGSALQQNTDSELECTRCQKKRQVSCRFCHSREFKHLRFGLSKARENLETLIKERVTELTAEGSLSSSTGSGTKHQNRVILGTTAALYRISEADVVAFLEFDQQLVLPDIRANERALGLLVRAAKMLGPKEKNKHLLIQTRLTDHPVIQSAAKIDPEILSRHDAGLRKELGLPPFKAVAEIARSGADDFIEALKRDISSTKGNIKTDLEILGPVDGRYLIKGSSQAQLAGVLNRIPRPPKKDIRIAVNPSQI